VMERNIETEPFVKYNPSTSFIIVANILITIEQPVIPGTYKLCVICSIKNARIRLFDHYKCESLVDAIDVHEFNKWELHAIEATIVTDGDINYELQMCSIRKEDYTYLKNFKWSLAKE